MPDRHALLVRALRSPAFSALVGLLERATPASRHVLPVLAYHRVDDPARLPLYPRLVSATPEEFGAQVAWLARRFAVVTLADVVAARLGEAKLPRRPLLLTFDDAYRDFADHAWPALRRAGLPVTLFVPTGYPGSPGQAFWWERLYASLASARVDALDGPLGTMSLRSPEERAAAYRALRAHVKSLPHDAAMALVDAVVAEAGEQPLPRLVLSWEELRALAADGVTLAPHTRTHPLLDRVEPARARSEAEASLADLEREIGAAPPVLAYPSGAFSRPVVDEIGSAGFQLAFTIGRRAVNDLRRDHWLCLRRLNVTRTIPPAALRAAVLPLAARAPVRGAGGGR